VRQSLSLSAMRLCGQSSFFEEKRVGENMDQNDLFLLAACSLIPKVREVTNNGGRTGYVEVPSAQAIAEAVKIAKKVWEEVLKQQED